MSYPSPPILAPLLKGACTHVYMYVYLFICLLVSLFICSLCVFVQVSCGCQMDEDMEEVRRL